MTNDHEIRRRWREDWFRSLQEFADIETQHRMWLDTSNTNPHFSFVEYICSYFDDLGLSENGYTSALKEGLVDENEVAVVWEFHQLADKYMSPTNDYDHRAILADPMWSEVVTSAEQARNELLALIDDPLERSILAGP